jgi:hypothetical protein
VLDSGLYRIVRDDNGFVAIFGASPWNSGLGVRLVAHTASLPSNVWSYPQHPTAISRMVGSADDTPEVWMPITCWYVPMLQVPQCKAPSWSALKGCCRYCLHNSRA